MWRETLGRIAHLFGRGRFDKELADEVRFHLESRADEHPAFGRMPA